MSVVLDKQDRLVEWCDNKLLKIVSNIYPDCDVKTPGLNMSKAELKALRKKPYVNNADVAFTVYYKNEQYVLMFKKGYEWDGASIPFGLRWIVGAKGSPEFLIPSMVHDKLCENHAFVKYNRRLSSLIFKELLKACGVSSFKAKLMFIGVDNYQKLPHCGWRKKD